MLWRFRPLVILIIVFICLSKKGPVRLVWIVVNNDFHIQYHLLRPPVNCFIHEVAELSTAGASSRV